MQKMTTGHTNRTLLWQIEVKVERLNQLKTSRIQKTSQCKKLEITKTLNNRKPQKAPRERAECIWGFNTSETVLNLIPKLHSIIATMLQASSPLLASLIGNLLF